MLEYWWRVIFKNNTNYEDETPRTLFALIDAHNAIYSESHLEESTGEFIDDV